MILLGVGQQAALRLAHRTQHQRLAILWAGNNGQRAAQSLPACGIKAAA